MAQYSHLSTPSAEIADALSKLPPPLFEGVDPAAMKAGFLNAIAAENAIKKTFMTLPSDDEVRVKEQQIPVEGGQIRVITYIATPSNAPAEESFPLLVWFHGGGWTVGGPEMDDLILRRVCFELKISIVNVDYRMAPEFPFPVPVNDCYEAIKWAADHASHLSASTARGLLIGGCSAGGNIAAALALRARDDPYFGKEEGKVITGQFLQVPVVIHPDVIPAEYKSELLSYEQNKNAPVLTAQDMYAFWSFYKPELQSPLFSPLLASSHQGLPPAYVQICGQDPLRDEGFLYEKVLNKNGVKTKLDVYPGYPHGGNYVLPGLEISKKFDDDFVEGVRWLLQNEHLPN
ncbi:alpha/beta hydrolase fold-domain-containing protein [Abortiporus biennis]|nr:alpha/beta hydrolase fold-domain-containing protein [Abortiporus biennis]